MLLHLHSWTAQQFLPFREYLRAGECLQMDPNDPGVVRTILGLSKAFTPLGPQETRVLSTWHIVVLPDKVKRCSSVKSDNQKGVSKSSETDMPVGNF